MFATPGHERTAGTLNRRAIVAMKRGSGFTLLELLVVLAIAGTLLALAPVAYTRFKETSDYRDTVRRMVADLAAARREAAEFGRATAFAVDLQARVFGVEGREARAIPDPLQVRATVAEVEYAEAKARIRFYPLGNTTGGNIEIRRPSGVGVRLHADWLDGRITLQALPE